MIPDDFDWMAHGSCRGKPTDLWFPGRGDGAAARAICATCPVAAECLEYAIADPLPVLGIFGGTDERERAAIRRARRAPRTLTA
jgi:WhiB family transcriptional regulator, redox-sensing transcriptional regulator